ncbi:MAG: carbamoyltransferase [Bacteroidetes bacterium]|nr:carbamoyltransferase [Bacteroidota bacterium]
MIILGINAYHADSSAAILVNGKLIAAIEEERFTRVKHWAGFPVQAIQFCLQEAGVSLHQVDHIAIGRDPKAKFFKKIFFLLKNPGGSLSVIKDRLFNAKKVSSLDEVFASIEKNQPEVLKNKIHQVEHHRSHLASAFFPSPFEKAALLSIDGSGDFTTTMTGIGEGNQLQVLDSIDFPHSLGLFYTAMTQWLGFPHYGDEYKVMGLAPYGEARYTEQIKEMIQCTDDGLFKLNLSYFRKATEGIISYGEDHIPVVATLFTAQTETLLGKSRTKDEPLSQYHKDIAASVQRVTEETIFHLLNHLHKKTGLQNVCIAGGVAQNSVANGKITRNTGFKNVYIPSAGHDAGISMGAAFYVQNQLLKSQRSEAIFSAYTGSHFSNEAIVKLLEQRGVSYRFINDEVLYEQVTNCLINAGVVGWFSGRSEFGPRALGGRSILADPRRSDAKDLLNAKIKRRESFRPFAPSILKEYVQDYFEVNDVVPFMEKVFPIREAKRSLIPAVTHVDGTGRLQTVDQKVSPRYYQLIETFRQKTGVPILLNTSFNENEPIVNTPEEALNCFLRTKMDMLVMENIVVERNS